MTEPNPSDIEAFRQVTGNDAIAELALDGLRFRAWCYGASNGFAVKLAVGLAKAENPMDYRVAIDKLLPEIMAKRAQNGVKP